MDRSSSLIKIFLFLYSSFYFTATVGTITSYILGTYIRLLPIGIILKSKLKRGRNMKFIVVHEINNQNDSEVIATLAEVYHMLIDVCDDINHCYGFQTMLGFGLIFLNTLFTSFTAYTDVVNDGNLSPSTIVSIAFSAYYNFFIASVLFSCSLLEKEVTPE